MVVLVLASRRVRRAWLAGSWLLLGVAGSLWACSSGEPRDVAEPVEQVLQEASTPLPAAADATLRSENENRDGHQPWLIAGNNARGALRRGLIRFDVRAIPSVATVTRVTLTLNVAKYKGAPVFALHRLTRSWTEGPDNEPAPTDTDGRQPNKMLGIMPVAGAPTWKHSNYPNTAWTTLGGDFVSTASGKFPPVSARGSLTVDSDATGNGDLETDVGAWVKGSANNYGWLLKLHDETPASTAANFSSREVTTKAPQLTVTYSLPECYGKTDGTACTADTNPCTTDVCVSEVCTHAAGNANAACADDGNPCTEDRCNGSSKSCQHVAQSGTTCNDGNHCTSNDTCVAGQCTSGPAKVCATPTNCQTLPGTCAPASGACNYLARPSGTSCDDGNAQTTGEACNGSGLCTSPVRSFAPASVTLTAADTYAEHGLTAIGGSGDSAVTWIQQAKNASTGQFTTNVWASGRVRGGAFRAPQLLHQAPWGGNSNPGQLAVSAAGRAVAAWSEWDGLLDGSGIPTRNKLYVATDSASFVWSAARKVSDDGHPSGVAFEPGGTPALLWLTSGTAPLRASRITSTIAAPVSLQSTGAPFPTRSGVFPGPGAASNVFAAFAEPATGGFNVFVRNYGTAWGSPTAAVTAPTVPAFAFAPNGAGALVWVTKPASGPRVVVQQQYQPSTGTWGQTWPGPFGNIDSFRMAYGATGKVVVVWAATTNGVTSLWSSEFRKDLNSWTSSFELSAGQRVAGEPHYDVAADSFGNILVAWVRLSPTTPGHFGEIQARRLVGSSWQATVSLDTIQRVNGFESVSNPRVALNQAGDGLVVWRRRTSSPVAGIMARVLE
jgi:hypothetical protein